MTAALPCDPALPGLAALRNPHAMRGRLALCLRPECCERYRIESCELIRFRHRPGWRFIAHYGVGVRDDATDEIMTQWLTVMTYADGGTRRTFEKIRSETSEDDHHNEFSHFQPLCYLAGDDLIIQAFPADRHLPQIQSFLRDLPADVVAGMLGTFGPGDWKVRHLAVEPSRYRPMMGLTLRYCIEACNAAGESLRRNFFVKLYRGAEGLKTWQKLAALNASLGDGPHAFGILGQGMWLERHRALILEEVRGAPLDTLLMDGVADMDTLMRHVADAMFAFHRSALAIDDLRLEDELSSRADHAVAFMANDNPELGGVLARIRAALHATPPAVEPRPAHCDLKPEHLLVDGGRVTFIDLDSAAMADPVYDVAMLLVRLQVMPTLSGTAPSVANAAADDLLRHYFRLAPAAWRARLPHQLGNAGLKVALFFVQHRIAGWPKKTRQLLDQIDAVLAGAGEVIPGRGIA